MYHIVHNIYKRLITNSLTLQNEMPKMDQAFVSTVLIWRALLELAYIVQFDTRNYLYLIALIARPQLYHWFSGMGILVCITCFILLLNLVFILPYRKYTSTIILIFNTNLLNYCFELSEQYVEYMAKTLLIIFLLWNIFILQGTLDAHVKNLEITKINILFVLTNMLNVSLMVLQTQNISNSVIMIIAYITAILQLVHHLYYNPYKIKSQLVIISSIYIITIYIGTLYIFELESKFSVQLILFPFFSRLLYTQIYIRTSGKNYTMDYILYNIEDKQNKEILIKDQLNSINDKIIYGSFLIINKTYFKALIYLQSMKLEQNPLLKIKKIILEQKCSALLDSKIQANLIQQNDLYISVRQLMENEAQFHQVVEEMIDVLKQKIYTYQCLIENQINHFDQMYKYTTQLIKLKKKLEDQYDKYPCDKNQNALGFLYAEVMYDYMGANKLYSIEALAEEKLKKKGIISDLFSNKMFYMISQFDNGNLNIIRLSNNAASSLSLTNDQLLNKNLEFLVPPGVRQWHRQLIEQAMQDGRSKYMRQLNENYYFDKRDGLLQTIDFAIDISFVSDINFICFLQPSISQPMVIVTDSQLNITCFSKELIRQIHCYPSTLINLNLKSIIPNFKEDATYMDNVIANFGLNDRSFSRSGSNANYITTIEIKKKKFNQETLYYFIIFEYLRKRTNQGSNNVDDSPFMLIDDQENHSKYSIKEDVTINIPLQDNQRHDSYFINPLLQDLKMNQYSTSSKQQVDVTGMKDDKEHTSLLFSPQQSVKKLVTQPLYFSRFYKQTISEKDSYQDQRSKQQQQQQFAMINEDKVIDDSASQVSSLQGMRKSKYFKKYEILRVLNELSSNSVFHKILIFNFLLAVGLQIILESVQLSQININLTKLVSDIDLLQIKNLVYQPLESFLVTRWAIFDYNLLRLANIITLEQYQEYGVYPRSNLALGYDSLADNIYSVLNRQELQSFLKNTFLEVELYIDTNIGQIYNVTLRNAINILLNYQYTFKMVYIIDGVAIIDSPYIYFSYRNYLVLKKVFSQLNEDILIQTINRSKQMESSMIILFIITICLLIVLFTFTYISTRKVFGLFERYLNILQGSEKSSFEHDLFILGLFLDKLKKDPGILFKYTFKFDKNEEIITQLGERLHPHDINRKYKLKQKTISSKSWAAFYFIIAIIICFNSFFTFASIYSYLKLYPNTSRYYKQLSDVGTDIPTMFAQREILYNRHLFPYFSQEEFSLIFKQVTDGLERTKQYTLKELDFSEYLLSNEFIDYYSVLEQGNLCLQLPEIIYQRSQEICQITMNGNLKRGLKTSLIYIINTIQTEMDINQFTQRDLPVMFQLEGAFQLSELIKLMNQKFNQDLNRETLSLLQKTTIVNIIILTFLAFTLIFIAQKFKNIFANKYYIVQRFLYLTPKKTLLFDDSFERQIRSIIIKDRKQ